MGSQIRYADPMSAPITSLDYPETTVAPTCLLSRSPFELPIPIALGSIQLGVEGREQHPGLRLAEGFVRMFLEGSFGLSNGGEARPRLPQWLRLGLRQEGVVS